jgi:hypothetical protein
VSDRPDLRELVGDDVPEEELRELERVDELLRGVSPPPAEIPATLTRAVRATAAPSIWTRRRVRAMVALAAALAALAFAAGAWLGDGSPGFEAQETILLEATESAPGASGIIRLGAAGEDGNWTLELEAAGLPELPSGGYYVLWLAKGGDYAGTCGTFRTGEGEATVRMNASYRLEDYDEWVVTAVRPNAPEGTEEPWLLRAPIERA